ncbi:glutamate synthase [NADH], amyloplastic isoform X1, partial [Paramuricea clavata]
MDFLEKNQKKQLGYLNDDVTHARDKNVIVIGGGDTGVDCVATCVRQNARKITTFELLNEPPKNRTDVNPWPQWPRVFRIEYGHEE